VSSAPTSQLTATTRTASGPWKRPSRRSWIWGDIESRHVATEAGISKGTLTGVASTLIARGLVARRVHPDGARRVLLALTPAGTELRKQPRADCRSPSRGPVKL
jgi:DNA-binding HxlR family transcriptional regulator